MGRYAVVQGKRGHAQHAVAAGFDGGTPPARRAQPVTKKIAEETPLAAAVAAKTPGSGATTPKRRKKVLASSAGATRYEAYRFA